MATTLFETQAAATEAFINSVKVNDGYVAYFKPALKCWHKAHGTPPTAQQLTVAVLLTNKHSQPGIECLSTAMSLRPEGYTVDQYTGVATTSGITGRSVGPANNKRRSILTAGHALIQVTGRPFCFHMVLTQKGITWLKGLVSCLELKALAAAAIAAPKATSKPKAAAGKPKAKKAPKVPVTETPTSEAPSLTEGQQLTVDEVINQQPVVADTVELGGVDADHDAVTATDLTALAAHFNNS